MSSYNTVALALLYDCSCIVAFVLLLLYIIIIYCKYMVYLDIYYHCMSPVRGTELLPELLICYESDILMMHLNSIALSIHAPHWVSQLHQSTSCCCGSLAACSPWRHRGTILCCFRTLIDVCADAVLGIGAPAEGELGWLTDFAAYH